jgi:hypothetical protein
MLNESPLLYYMHCCATDKNFKFENRNESLIAMVTIERPNNRMGTAQAEVIEPDEE